MPLLFSVALLLHARRRVTSHTAADGQRARECETKLAKQALEVSSLTSQVDAAVEEVGGFVGKLNALNEALGKADQATKALYAHGSILNLKQSPR